MLQVADLVDIAAAQAPRPLLLEALVDGRNAPPTSSELTDLRPLVQAYQNHPVPGNLLIRRNPDSVAEWLAGQLRR
jgi:hypothetical protein